MDVGDFWSESFPVEQTPTTPSLRLLRYTGLDVSLRGTMIYLQGRRRMGGHIGHTWSTKPTTMSPNVGLPRTHTDSESLGQEELGEDVELGQVNTLTLKNFSLWSL